MGQLKEQLKDMKMSTAVETRYLSKVLQCTAAAAAATVLLPLYGRTAHQCTAALSE